MKRQTQKLIKLGIAWWVFLMAIATIQLITTGSYMGYFMATIIGALPFIFWYVASWVSKP